MNYRTAFSYYGGKGMIVSRYPQPMHKKIIEPFAGGAAYSLKYYRHDVELYELNKETCKMWYWYQDPILLNKVPKKIIKGMNRDDLINGLPEGLQLILTTFVNIGQGGTIKKGKHVTSHGAYNWEKNINKLKYWANKIKHWKIYNKSYTTIKNKRATWFIDPPYQDAGYLYVNNGSDIKYKKLKKWCLNRIGQKIICENIGNNWINIKPLMKKTPGFNHVRKNCNRKQEGLLHILK